MPDPAVQENWENLMVGLAVYGFFGERRKGNNASWSEEQHGVDGARRYADYRVKRGTLTGPVAVVSLAVQIDRLLDLEAKENLAFCDAVSGAMVKLAAERDWDTDVLCELTSAEWIGKVINAGLEQLPQEWAPQACRLHLPPEANQLQPALAIFRAETISETRLVGEEAALRALLGAP